MKIFRSLDFAGKENPTPGVKHREDLLNPLSRAVQLRGMFIALPPATEVPLHYHERRESLILFIKGAGKEIGEGEEFSVGEGDVIYVPAREKHKLINVSPDEELRYLEFYTTEDDTVDFITVESCQSS